MIWIRQRRSKAAFVIASLAFAWTAGPAHAQPMDVYAQCEGTLKVSSERGIVACTSVLLATDLRPERRATYLARRARLYQETKQFDKAVADYDIAIELNHGSADLYRARCWARAAAGSDLDLALADCDRSLKDRPGSASTLALRGFVNLRKGDYPAAIADSNAAIALTSKPANSLYVRGLAKHKTGDTAGGDKDIAAAEAIDPKIADMYAGYGVTP